MQLQCLFLVLLTLVACQHPQPPITAVPSRATTQPTVTAATTKRTPTSHPLPTPTLPSLPNSDLPTFAGDIQFIPTPTTQPTLPTYSLPMALTQRTDEPMWRVTAPAPSLQVAHVPIGFHVASTGFADGLGDWMRQLDAAGVPFFLKSVDGAGALFEAQERMRRSGVPHVLVYRRSGGAYELPNYDTDPTTAAQAHWALHKAAWPPELDPALVWLETVNEGDHTRAGWWGTFAQETARLALRDGFKWAAFGWSAGEPEVEDWLEPTMLGFLEMAGANPDRLAVALHEYSFNAEAIDEQYPFRIGRFQQLFLVCDQMGIPRPTVLITEWGWTLWDVPPPETAIAHIERASRLYAMYPEVLGAATWYLGGGFKEIDRETQRLIAPVTAYALHTYFLVPRNPVGIDAALFEE